MPPAAPTPGRSRPQPRPTFPANAPASPAPQQPLHSPHTHATAAFAFTPATRASTARAPARMSKQPSAKPANGSAAENGTEPHPSTSATSTARAASISSNAFTTAAFPITPSWQRGTTFKGPNGFRQAQPPQRTHQPGFDGLNHWNGHLQRVSTGSTTRHAQTLQKRVVGPAGLKQAQPPRGRKENQPRMRSIPGSTRGSAETVAATRLPKYSISTASPISTPAGNQA